MTHFLTNSLTHSVTHSFIHSFIQEIYGNCKHDRLFSFLYVNLSTFVIDSLKLIFSCDVFVGVSDRIQCHFFGQENDGNASCAFYKTLTIASMSTLQVVGASLAFHLI